MESNLQDLEVVDLGDARDLTQGMFTMHREEDSLAFPYRALPS